MNYNQDIKDILQKYGLDLYDHTVEECIEELCFSVKHLTEELEELETPMICGDCGYEYTD